jgi:hypothetical protein
MQRGFSNRGEALAEVTAARVRARRTPARSAPISREGLRGTNQQWFSPPVEAPRRPKTREPKRYEDDITPQ